MCAGEWSTATEYSEQRIELLPDAPRPYADFNLVNGLYLTHGGEDSSLAFDFAGLEMKMWRSALERCSLKDSSMGSLHYSSLESAFIYAANGHFRRFIANSLRVRRRFCLSRN